ncbi:MAG: tRNA (guanosine(37)-N1)-methyltransferase TrmD [bacterium]|nr:tRNA (guanosine(37)-N1)-methyltransferase TrmD [bacterium]
MKITILTLFPEYFTSPFSTSIIKRSAEKSLAEISILNIRDYTTDKHHMTDDRPFGGGPGMVMKIEPIYNALTSIKASKGTSNEQILLTSAKGSLFTQSTAQSLSGLERVIIICGHYEGVDERVVSELIDGELRIGDYVLTGGEPAAAVITDAVVRLLPGVLGNESSNQDESHTVPGTLGYPQYTRPEEFNGWKVPEILLAGHHEQIKKWRKQQRKTVAKE